MVGDRYRDHLVLGMTEHDLIRRFGFLRTPANANTMQKYYYEHIFKGQNVAWLRDSPWMVVFENGRVVRLVLCKG